MGTSPYRTPAERPLFRDDPQSPMDDADLVPVFTIAWVASLVRVVLAIVRAETFGVEMTLCLFAFFTLPALAMNGLLAVLRRHGW